MMSLLLRDKITHAYDNEINITLVKKDQFNNSRSYYCGKIISLNDDYLEIANEYDSNKVSYDNIITIKYN